MSTITLEQQAIIDAIKQQHPDKQITVTFSVYNDHSFRVTVATINQKYLSLALIPDTQNNFRWMINDIDNKLVVRVTAYNTPNRKQADYTFGLMDKNDLHNLERAVRLAIKLFEEI